MVRNFIILNIFPFFPTLSCKKSGEEQVSAAHMTDSISNRGKSIKIAAKDKIISAVLFKYLYDLII